jgi:hypothetical protein
MSDRRSFTYTQTFTDLCLRCEHPRDWHRHDDMAPPNVNGHNSHGADTTGNEHDCPCRCVGEDVTRDGWSPKDDCDCPAYVGEVAGDGQP